MNITQDFTQSSSDYGNTIEGCNDLTIHFELYEALPYDYVIGLTYGGTAVNGVDFPLLPDSIVIPTGSIMDSITIAPYQDGIIEPTETITIGLDYESACATEQDTIYSFILDNSISFSGLEALYCTDYDPDTLSFYPPDAKISGLGIIDSIFYPNLADIGLNQIFCTKYFIDTTGMVDDTVCTNQLMLETTVGQAAFAFAGSDTSMCQADPLDFSGLEQLPDSSDCDSILWIGGAGNFSDRRVLHPIYFSSPDDLGPLQLGLVAFGVPPCGNDTSYMTLQVDSIPEGTFNVVPIDTCCTNSIVQFSGNSTCIITQWEWDFGDGSPLAYGQVVTHQYANPGNYNVTMTLYNQYGCTGDVQTVKIVEDVDENIIADTIACLEETHAFSGTGNITFTDYEWDFGDGNTDIGKNVTHTYTSPGVYNVRLAVCSDTNYLTVYVNDMPTATFTNSPQDTTCTNNEIIFNGVELSGSVDSWLWDFGDDFTANGQIVSHTYTSQGDYTAYLYYSNTDGCYDTIAKNIRIEEIDINFTRNPNPSCHGSMITFQGIDFNGNTGFSQWEWDFGDGSPAAYGQNVGHIYANPGDYDVMLVVCTDTIIRSVTVSPQAFADAGGNQATCEDVAFDFSESDTPPFVSGEASIYWYGGAGSFNNPNIEQPVYTPGATELGPVTLTMVGYGIAPCENDTSTLEMLVVEGAYAYAGSDENGCFGEAFDFSTAVDTAFATNWDTLYWQGGTGYFIDPNVPQPIYVPGPGRSVRYN
ncbi:MAG: PKD domain-containing protein [Bacteroidota bacterium]|nr:PKD domain-containing protein [Bacteroidota bacterium]